MGTWTHPDQEVHEDYGKEDAADVLVFLPCVFETIYCSLLHTAFWGQDRCSLGPAPCCSISSPQSGPRGEHGHVFPLLMFWESFRNGCFFPFMVCRLESKYLMPFGKHFDNFAREMIWKQENMCDLLEPNQVLMILLTHWNTLVLIPILWLLLVSHIRLLVGKFKLDFLLLTT